jgi:hypothetical protein
MTHRCHYSHRRGLSTLEMVLVLPILLFIMALMINYGTVACWKVRGSTVARHELWGSRWPRTGGSNPRPTYWPATASASVSDAGHVPEIDDPRVDQPVARGPLPHVNVKRNLLDPTRGLREGAAGISRDFPLLAKLGPYHLDAHDRLLDDKWQYQRMGLGSNVQLRIPVIYGLAKAPARLVEAYAQAVETLMGAAFQPALRPLDHDDEFIKWRGGAPDFYSYPALQQFCTLDRQVADERVQSTVDRVRGKTERDAEGRVRHIPSVAEYMADAFKHLYEEIVSQSEGMLKAQPPPLPAEQAALQAQIAEYKQKIEWLKEFLKSIRKAHGG